MGALLGATFADIPSVTDKAGSGDARVLENETGAETPPAGMLATRHPAAAYKRPLARAASKISRKMVIA